MLNKVIGAISLLLSGAWWLGIGREFIKAVIFDRILHMLSPSAWHMATLAFQYGPPVLLAVLGVYLLARRPSPPRTTPVTEQLPRDIVTPKGLEDDPDPTPITPAPSPKPRPKWRRTSRRANTTAPTGTPKSRRVFVDVSPSYLMDLFDGMTTLQGDALAAAYIGKWITTTFKVADISDGANVIIVQAIEREDAFSKDGSYTGIRMISAWFTAESSEEIYNVAKGATVTVRGEIFLITKVRVTIQKCELSEPI